MRRASAPRHGGGGGGRTPPPRPSPAGPTPPGDDPLAAYEQELSDVVPPRFARAGDEPEPVAGEADRVSTWRPPRCGWPTSAA